MKFTYKLFDNIFFSIFLLVVMTAFIFSNSSVTAEVSSNESSKVVEIVTEIIEKTNIKIDEADIVKTVRKTAHFSEFFALGAVCYYLRFVISKHPIKLFSIGLLYGIFVALIDESLQYTSVGRSPEVIDVWIDVVGFCFAYFLFMVLFALISKKLVKPKVTHQAS